MYVQYYRLLSIELKNTKEEFEKIKNEFPQDKKQTVLEIPKLARPQKK